MTSRNISMSPVTKGRTCVHVVPTEDGWLVRRDGADRATGVYRTQAEATEAAQSVLRRSGGEVRVQGRDGRIRESMTVGRESMARIAAVEGIHLSAEAKRTLADFDRAGASGDERRRSIARQFGKKA
ncbi:DUF2188 domain-containing protein [Reyranella sp.]|uniref:DUF2188 domain-containing protein n=1 Tax=Reyranella sp. TaxID=1929291 RepID=UPI003D11786D